MDGTQTVTITAAADGHAGGTDTVDVTDDDLPELTVTIAVASISEGDGPGATTATVSRKTDTTSDLVVTLLSDDTSEATVTATVTILAGQSTSPPFDIDAIADEIIDGTQTVTVTASAADHAGGSDTLDVLDDDTASTTLIIDNGDSGFSTVGKWVPYTGQGYENDVHYSAAGSGADVASWSFTGLPPGQYQVSVTWAPLSNRATNAPYQIFDNAELLYATTVNQKLAPEADAVEAGKNFQNLGGVVTISSGTLMVELSDNANQYVIADAVRIEPIVAPPVRPLSIVAAPVSASGGSTTAATASTGESTNPQLADLSANNRVFVSAGNELISAGVRLEAGATAPEDHERDLLFASCDRDWLLTDNDCKDHGLGAEI